MGWSLFIGRRNPTLESTSLFQVVKVLTTEQSCQEAWHVLFNYIHLSFFKTLVNITTM